MRVNYKGVTEVGTRASFYALVGSGGHTPDHRRVISVLGSARLKGRRFGGPRGKPGGHKARDRCCTDAFGGLPPGRSRQAGLVDKL